MLWSGVQWDSTFGSRVGSHSLARMDHGVPWLTWDKKKKGPWKRMKPVKSCTASVSQEVDGGRVCHGHL